jgi:adenylosuccinate synthase
MADRAILVIGLAFGDCGKGSIVDFLARRHEARLVVRFNGGPQAGHNVVTPDGRHHTFSQFGSATFLPGTRTFLSRFMLIEPYAMFNEARHLAEIGAGDAMERLTVDGRCPVITPCHQAANRIREIARGAGAHGTCGMGIGELMQDREEGFGDIIFAAELGDREGVRRKLRATRDFKVGQLREEIKAARGEGRAKLSVDTLERGDWIDTCVDNYAELARRIGIVADAREIIPADGTIIFEGAQGVLLDESLGFQPHTTWSKTTFVNAEAVLNEAGYGGERVRLGVLRSYFTRHGAGPMVSEEVGLKHLLAEEHNGDHGWQGAFRVGSFDAVAARYALRVAGGVDRLAVTCLDRLGATNGGIVGAYEREGEILRELPGSFDGCRAVVTSRHGNDPKRFMEALREELNCAIQIASHGPTAADKYIV